MPFDALFLDKEATLLREKLVGGKINKIAESGSKTLFYVYINGANYKLCFDFSFGSGSVYLDKKDVEKSATQSGFSLSLKKHLTGGVIKDIACISFDRILRIDIECFSEFEGVTEKVLYAELMGKYSNLILVNNGVILSVKKTLPLSENTSRVLLVGVNYSLPKNDKLSPFDSGLIEVFNAAKDLPLTDRLFKFVRGISSTTAEEIAYRFSLAKIKDSGENLFNFLNGFITETKIIPCMAEDYSDAFLFPYFTRQTPYRYFDDLLGLTTTYCTEKSKTDTFIRLKKEISDKLKRESKKCDKKLSLCIEQERDASNYEEEKKKGELILSNIYKIKKGDTFLIAEDYSCYPPTSVKINIDESILPSLNAEKFFKRYRKKKRTIEALKERKAEVIEERDYLDSLFSMAEAAESISDLTEIKAEISPDKEVKGKKSKNGQKSYKTFIVNGFKVLCGRSNVENDEIRELARGNDIWLHVLDNVSSHVVIFADKKKVDDATLRIAAEVCAHNSKLKGEEKVPVVYTFIKYVIHPKGKKAGFVNYSEEKTIAVKPNRHEELLKT